MGYWVFRSLEWWRIKLFLILLSLKREKNVWIYKAFKYGTQIAYTTYCSTVNETAGEEARRQLHKNAASNLEQVLAATPHKTPTVLPPASYHENYSR